MGRVTSMGLSPIASGRGDDLPVSVFHGSLIGSGLNCVAICLRNRQDAWISSRPAA
ncbi:hypothetical protein AGR6A_Cc50005 [Agrobacterium sp. NCPPB 925]|nr:hypothetical protein AGR6A_Cc50005 [Agrobacterium sp. NCPPB 925]